MKYRTLKTSICLSLLLAGALTVEAATPAARQFTFTPAGIASIKIGDDYSDIPASCPGLYSRIAYLMCCGGEDGEGVELLFYNDEEASDYIIDAALDVNQRALDMIYDQGLECNYFSIDDSRITNLLRSTRSTTVSSITVTPSPHVTVSVAGRELATDEPAVKFMALPGAVTTVSIGEGLYVSCVVDGLYMAFVNAYEFLTDEAITRVTQKLAPAIETGIFEPVTITPADVIPEVRFHYFTYPGDSDYMPR